jgi:hypothetical protein
LVAAKIAHDKKQKHLKVAAEFLQVKKQKDIDDLSLRLASNLKKINKEKKKNSITSSKYFLL